MSRFWTHLKLHFSQYICVFFVFLGGNSQDHRNKVFIVLYSVLQQSLQVVKAYKKYQKSDVWVINLSAEPEPKDSTQSFSGCLVDVLIKNWNIIKLLHFHWNYCAVIWPSVTSQVTKSIAEKLHSGTVILSACDMLRNTVFIRTSCCRTSCCIKTISFMCFLCYPRCTKCFGDKYNADKPFKANASWKAGKGKGTQLSAKHIFFKGCP